MKRIFSFLITIILIFSFCIALSEDAFQQDMNYGLTQSEEIIIPIFTGENMKKFDLPDSEALNFIRNLRIAEIDPEYVE